MDYTFDPRLLVWGLLFLPGVSALEDGVGGIIGSTIAAGLMLVAIIIVGAILCYRNTSFNEPIRPRHRKPAPKPKYDMNGNAPNGIPLQTRVPNGFAGTPHGTQRSNRSRQIGSHRGAPGPLRFAVAPPGLYRSMMAPYFMHPPYQQVIYIDESDDESLVRSTMREHKKKYRRSYFSASKDASSKIEIKKRSRRPHPKLRDFVRSNPPGGNCSGEEGNKETTIEEKTSHSSSSKSISSKSSIASDRSQTRKEKPKNRITKDDRERDSERHSRSSSTASYPKPKWEVESAEEQIKLSDEETGKKSPPRKRSKSPEKQKTPRPRSRSRSPENAVPLRQSVKQETLTRVSKESNDETRQIDDIFSSVHAEASPGDIIFRESEGSPKQTTPRKSYSEEERREEEEPFTSEYAKVIKPSQKIRESTRSSMEDSGALYASVIKPTSVEYDGSRDNPLRQSMSNTLEDIIQGRHDGKPSEFDKVTTRRKRIHKLKKFQNTLENLTAFLNRSDVIFLQEGCSGLSTSVKVHQTLQR
uniref:Serine/arginine repetitive matrix protein 1-like isoform X1 n=1 Tax=Crassostrea virginica TaxID=6565 RepID=A0A8B8CMG3_CRAVI|nr:serine/arginine repetitive matrix protein 1-like isoform X1 [Crassostrea virginica]